MNKLNLVGLYPLVDFRFVDRNKSSRGVHNFLSKKSYSEIAKIKFAGFKF
jgi:hypothetical protein